jgi:hypothetical protein
MAVVETIEIQGDSSGFEEQIKKLNKRVEELEETLKGAGVEAKKVGAEGEKAAKKTASAWQRAGNVLSAPFKVAGKAAKAFGNILKTALSFGGAVAIVDKLTEAFSSNQKVVDALNKILTTASIIFNQIAEAIFGAFEEQSKLNGGFDATKKVLGGLIAGSLNVLVGVIQSIKLGVLAVQLAWEKSIFGDGDKGRIKELNKEISTTTEELKKTGTAIADSGKQIVTNLGEAASEVAGAVAATATAAVKAVQEIDIDKATADAENLVELRKAAARADIERQKIQLAYQQREEKLRQLRDDETQSIEARQKANEDLLALLKEQAKEERAQLEIKKSAAAAEYARQSTEENYIALKQAEVELIDLSERLEGQVSEALMNKNALAKEGLEIQKSAVEAANQAFITQEQARLDAEINAKIGAAELIRNEGAKAQRLYEIEQERIAKQQALNDEARNKQLKLVDEELARIEASGQTNTQYYQDLTNTKLQIDADYLAQKQTLETEAANNQVNRDKQVLENRRALNEASLQIAGQGIAAISALQEAFQKKAADGDERTKRRQFQIQKKLSLASAVVSGVEAVQNAFKSALASPITTLLPAYPAIQAGLAGAFAAAQVATIARSQYESSTSISQSEPQVQTATAPSVQPRFNVVGQSGVNQLAQSINGQNSRPVKAYVVGSEVTSATELDRKRTQTASFG